MPHYKLTSFNQQGRAQPIHLLFAQAGVEYENIEVGFTDEAWIAYKPKTPFGQLPVLEVDGKMIAQCGAISDYLAKQFGLNGKDDWEAAKIQELANGTEDFVSCFRPWFFEKDEAKKVLRDRMSTQGASGDFTTLSVNGDCNDYWLFCQFSRTNLVTIVKCKVMNEKLVANVPLISISSCALKKSLYEEAEIKRKKFGAVGNRTPDLAHAKRALYP